jgi:general nucleoside transport system permease protein
MSDILLSTLRLSVPLLFAAYAGLMSERSGVANIALEALLLVSAFAAAATAPAFGDPYLAAAAGVGAAMVVGAMFGVVCLYGRGDQVVVGTGFNLLAAGFLPILTKAFFDSTGATASLDQSLTFHEPWAFFALAIVVLVGLEFMFRRTRHGLRITAAGENPMALRTLGVNEKRVRLRAIIEGSALAGIGGVYLSLCQGSGYIRDMSAGRGFIALAALIFGAWKPLPTFAACLFFAFTDAIQIQLQGQTIGGVAVPNQFVQIMPYVATLLVLVVFARRLAAPKAINRDIGV